MPLFNSWKNWEKNFHIKQKNGLHFQRNISRCDGFCGMLNLWMSPRETIIKNNEMKRVGEDKKQVLWYFKRFLIENILEKDGRLFPDQVN
jgi:hypothetical protein